MNEEYSCSNICPKMEIPAVSMGMQLNLQLLKTRILYIFGNQQQSVLALRRKQLQCDVCSSHNKNGHALHLCDECDVSLCAVWIIALKCIGHRTDMADKQIKQLQF